MPLRPVRDLRLASPASAPSKPWRKHAPPRRTAGAGLARPARRPTATAPTAGSTDAAKLQRLEAALWLAREPIPLRKLAQQADLADGAEARRLVEVLRQRLRRRGSAFAPAEVAGGVQLLTRPELANWLTRLYGPAEDLRLSPPALETLAVAVYRRPVTRAEIEAVRGVQCGELLRLLMERDLLRIVGRSEELGRPFLYGPTRKFLQVFGLRRLEQLPPVDQIRNA